MDTLLRDVRFASRRLASRPGFTLIALLSLALGIGANTAIFSLVDAVVLRKTPVRAPHELVDLYIGDPDFAFSPLSYADLRDVREATGDVFTGVVASKISLTQRDLGDDLETVTLELVSGNYFELLGIRPALGRFFVLEEEVTPGGHPLAVLSHDYWQRAFAGDPSAIGAEVRLRGRTYTVIGVAPADYEGNLRGLAPALYLPIMMINDIEGSDFDQLEGRGARSIFVKARLAPGATVAQARTVLAGLVAELRERDPRYWPPGADLRVVPSQDVIIHPSVDRVVLPAAGLLLGVVGLVLLIACANLASFLLAQASGRRKEIAIRLALGAGRAGLVRQLLTETILLALAGGALGVLLATWFLRLLVNLDLPLPLPITLDLRLDARVLGFALLVSAAAGVLFGLAPALQSTRPDMAGTLRDEATGGGRPRRIHLRDALVVGQVTLSVVLLVAAALFLRSFQARQRVDPGFGQQPAAMLWLAVPTERYDEEAARVLARRLIDRTAALPAVNAVGVTANMHLDPVNTTTTRFNVDGHSPPPGEVGFLTDWTSADAGFFDAVGVRIVRGRNFDRTIDIAGSPRVAIVNEVLAERFWPGEDPIGRTLRHGDGDMRVIGVASNVKVRALGEAPRSFVYTSFEQRYEGVFFIVAQTTGSADRVARDMLGLVREIDREIVVLKTRTMAKHLAVVLLPARLGALALMAFAGLALALALIGLYGVVSYAVARRTREVGIRIALGAEPSSVVRMMMHGGLRLVAIGGAAGLLLAWAGTRLLQSLLFGVGALDPVTFLLAPLLLAGVAVLATWLPARRATRIDPVRAIRSE